jgi:hypothetical protein
MAEAYIVEAVRTAGGRRNGKLAGWHPADMAAETLNAVVERSGIDPAAVEDVILGCITQAGEQAFAFGRNAVLASRLPETVPAVTIDRQCGRSQLAVQFAAQAVMSGTQDIVIAAGAESMTRVPMFSNIALHQKAGIGADPFSDRIKQRVMVGQLDHRASQQLERPAGATFGRARTGSGHKQGFFVAGQLTVSTCPRLLVQGGFEIAFNEAALGPVNGRAADSHSSGNLFVAEPAVGGQQNLGSFDLAGVRLAAPQQRGEFTPLGFAQFDVVAYVHPGLLANREAQTNQAMNQLFGTCPRLPRSPTSKVSTWPSSTPTAVSSANRPRKPTCSGISKSRHPACIRWCLPSNARAS